MPATHPFPSKAFHVTALFFPLSGEGFPSEFSVQALFYFRLAVPSCLGSIKALAVSDLTAAFPGLSRMDQGPEEQLCCSLCSQLSEMASVDPVLCSLSQSRQQPQTMSLQFRWILAFKAEEASLPPAPFCSLLYCRDELPSPSQELNS